MNAKRKKVLEAIKGMDLRKVSDYMWSRHKKATGRELSATTLSHAAADYRNFLCLKACYPDQVIVPTRLMDLMWETHILDTQKYIRDSAAVLAAAGQTQTYVHHDPHVYPGTPEHAAGVQLRNDLFQQHFNRLPFPFDENEHVEEDGETCA